MDNDLLKGVWNQPNIPVVLRRTGKGELLRVRLPPRSSNEARDCGVKYRWLRNNRSRLPIWRAEGKYWELPKAWFNDFVNRSLNQYGKVYIIQPYNAQETCAPACMKAEGHVCECSCMGENHGVGNDGSWFEVSEAFATRWNGRELACRLLTQRGAWTAPSSG